jgi:hypothetical protein
VLIIQILTNVHPESLFKLFKHDIQFYRWLGDIAVRSHHSFGALCCSIACTPQSRFLFLVRFLQAQSGSVTSHGLSALSCLCGFVSLLMRLALDADVHLDPLDLNSCVLKACQMVPYNPENVLSLLSSVSHFYSHRLAAGASGYVAQFFQFRQSFLFVFDQKLDSTCFLRCLEAVRFLFSRQIQSEDTSPFGALFLMRLLGFMASQQEALLVAAWSVFRNWALVEALPGRLLRTTEHLRTAFGALLALASTTFAMTVQLLLMFDGYLFDPESGEPVLCSSGARRRAIRDLLSRMLVEQRLSIVALREKALAQQGRPGAVRWTAELAAIGGAAKGKTLLGRRKTE